MGETGIRETVERESNSNTGTAIGSFIAIVFGLVFVEVNGGGLATPWPAVIRVAGVVVAVALLAVLVLAPRGRVRAERSADDGPSDDQRTFFGSRRYWVIVAIEVVALFGGLAVINDVLDHGEVGISWIAVVVGLHFLGLGWAFRLGRFHVLGAVMIALGVAGFLLDAFGAGAAVIGLVSGVLSGASLFATAGYALLR